MKLRALGLVALVLVLAGSARAAITFVAPDELPAAVRATVGNWAHDASIGVITRDSEPGRPPLYRLRLTYQGTTYELVVAEDGRLISAQEIH